MTLLRLDRERSDRTGFETLQGDRLAGLLAVAVGPLLDRLHRLVDLGDQLTEAVAGPQFKRAIGFGSRAIGEIGLMTRPAEPFARGKVRFQKPVLGAEEWECVADAPIAMGERVRVVAIEGSFLKVVKA